MLLGKKNQEEFGSNSNELFWLIQIYFFDFNYKQGQCCTLVRELPWCRLWFKLSSSAVAQFPASGPKKAAFPPTVGGGHAPKPWSPLAAVLELRGLREAVQGGETAAPACPCLPLQLAPEGWSIWDSVEFGLLDICKERQDRAQKTWIPSPPPTLLFQQLLASVSISSLIPKSFSDFVLIF